MIPQTGHEDWDDNSKNLPGIVGMKGAVILGTAIGGGIVLFGILKKRGEYDLQVAEKLEFETDSGRLVLSLVNRGADTLTLSELKFDKKGFKTAATLSALILPVEPLDSLLERELLDIGKTNN